MKKSNRGFTLIELLVVIAIIGILSSVVLASLNDARTKGANSSIKSSLNNIRAQAELYYDDSSPNSYLRSGAVVGPTSCVTTYTAAQNLLGDAVVRNAMAAAASAGQGSLTGTNSRCWVSGSGYGISIRLKAPENGNNYWCIDSSGQSKAINNGSWAAPVGNAGACG